MRKISAVLIFLSAILFSNCGSPSQNRNEKIVSDASMLKDTFHLLTQYWQLTDADHPAYKDISFTTDEGILNVPGIVFMTDSTLLENPVGEKTYGKFTLQGNKIQAKYDGKRKADYIIDRINKDELVLSRTEDKRTSKLTYKATHTRWPDAGKNPFARKNYAWSQKPKKAESDIEIKNRVKGYLQFFVYYFDGFTNGDAKEIDFTALPDCLNWYQGGITIQNEDKLDTKWMDCFYSKEQAYKGRQMLEDAIVKKYDWNTKEASWIKQTASVLQQMHDGM